MSERGVKRRRDILLDEELETASGERSADTASDIISSHISSRLRLTQDELPIMPEVLAAHDKREYPRLAGIFSSLPEILQSCTDIIIVSNIDPLKFQTIWEGVMLRWSDILRIDRDGFMGFLDCAGERFWGGMHLEPPVHKREFVQLPEWWARCDISIEYHEARVCWGEIAVIVDLTFDVGISALGKFGDLSLDYQLYAALSMKSAEGSWSK